MGRLSFLEITKTICVFYMNWNFVIEFGYFWKERILKENIILNEVNIVVTVKYFILSSSDFLLYVN